MIEIAGVSLALGGSRILDNVSLTVPKGGVTALVGPNGAGKSSLLSLIARLRPLQSGRITVDGLPVDTTPTPAVGQDHGHPATGSRRRKPPARRRTGGVRSFPASTAGG